MTSPAARYGAAFAALYAAHHVGDYWVQTDAQAQLKGQRDRAGQLACARHVATYTATSALAVTVADSYLDLGCTGKRMFAGQALNAGLHYFFDRRYTAQWMYRALDRISGKMGFVERGGAAHLDQAFHIASLAVVAAVIAGRGK